MGDKYEIAIPRPGGGPLTIAIEGGHSIVVIGANGSGKTRLSVLLEDGIPADKVHRISAQKSLTVNDAVQLTSLERAEKMLRFGNADGAEYSKPSGRWAHRPAVHPLNDFDALLQRLFAEHNRTAIDFLERAEKDRASPVPISRFRQLKDIWDELLPHRELKLREATVEVMQNPSAGKPPYAGSEMSDGERAIFYFLGQCLVAGDDSAIIIDEPEGHVHKAILGPLWDAIEEARPDCGFVYITHDLDFAVARAAAKYFIRSYSRDPQSWDIAELPQDTGLSDNVVAEIVGSRKPILFVEGERGSLDITIYRHRYDSFTIVPIGGCEAVIHSVASYKNSSALHWLDAKGLVDADHRSPGDVEQLQANNVAVLPVAEVDNLLLLPDVFIALAEALACADPSAGLKDLTDKVLQTAQQQVESVSARYTSRRLDERLKRVAHAVSDLTTLQANYNKELADIDPAAMFHEFKTAFEKAIQDRDLELVLKLFDNKTLPSIASGLLGLRDNAQKLTERVGRLLGDKEKGVKLRDAIAKYLPSISVSTIGKPSQNIGTVAPIAAARAG